MCKGLGSGALYTDKALDSERENGVRWEQRGAHSQTMQSTGHFPQLEKTRAYSGSGNKQEANVLWLTQRVGLPSPNMSSYH